MVEVRHARLGAVGPSRDGSERLGDVRGRRVGAPVISRRRPQRMATRRQAARHGRHGRAGEWRGL
uniref:Uncharacterized protein n=1 Tax=Oryza barthii TaxID=65489 RepID=A0A0D3GGI0_9ORYZ